MAVLTQEQITPERERPARGRRRRAVPWPSPSQLRRSAPVLRLLTEIWAIPEVTKVGLLVDDDGVGVRVLVREEDRAVRSKIYATERAYLNETPPHEFKLWVSSASKVGDAMPRPFEVVLER